MTKRYFAKDEAATKVGKTIRTLTEWSGVPSGTTGTVVRAELVATVTKYAERFTGSKSPAGKPEEVYDLAIEWNLPASPIRGDRPLVDWFSKDEYEKYLVEE